MSKEEKKGFFSNVRNQIIAGTGVVLTTLGTVFTDKIEEFFGVEDDAAVEVTQEQNVNVEGPTITINIPEQKKDTVVKKVYVKPKEKLTETEKRKKEGIDWKLKREDPGCRKTMVSVVKEFLSGNL